MHRVPAKAVAIHGRRRSRGRGRGGKGVVVERAGVACAVLLLAGLGMAGWRSAAFVPAAGGSEARIGDDPAEIFRRFLENPEPVRRMVYSRSFSRHRILAVDDQGRERAVEPRPVLEHLELAWQPMGWYRRFGEGSHPLYRTKGWKHVEFERPVPGAEPVVGTNPEYSWSLNNGHTRLSIVARLSREEAPNDWRMARAMDTRTIYDLRFGLDALGPGRLQWISPEEFLVEEVDYLLFGGGHGRIVAWDSRQRPTELVYAARNAKGRYETWKVRYTYRDDRPFPPWLYVVEENSEDRGRLWHTNYVDEFEPGLDPAAPRGYYPEMFRRANTPYEMVTLYSNDVRYMVSGQGRLHRLPDVPYEPLRQPHTNVWFKLLVSGVVLAGGAAVWLGLRRRRGAS